MNQLIEWVKSLLGWQQPTTSESTSAPTAPEAMPPAEIKEQGLSESEKNTNQAATETREEERLIVEDSSDNEGGFNPLSALHFVVNKEYDGGINFFPRSKLLIKESEVQ